VVAAKRIIEPVQRAAVHEAAQRRAAVQQDVQRPRQAGMGTGVELSDIDRRVTRRCCRKTPSALHCSSRLGATPNKERDRRPPGGLLNLKAFSGVICRVQLGRPGEITGSVDIYAIPFLGDFEPGGRHL
jgi:hypothetical protein